MSNFHSHVIIMAIAQNIIYRHLIQILQRYIIHLHGKMRVRPCHNFAPVITAELSWHVQICGIIKCFQRIKSWALINSWCKRPQKSAGTPATSEKAITCIYRLRGLNHTASCVFAGIDLLCMLWREGLYIHNRGIAALIYMPYTFQNIFSWTQW